jgi:hypothetical protein
MRVPWFAVLVLTAVLVACSGGSSGNGGTTGGSSGSSGGGSSGGSSGGGSSGGGSSSGGSSTGSSGSGSGTDSGADPDAGVSADSITFTMGPFTVPAGTEVFKCQTFANPFGGVTTDIKDYDEHMTTGSHHMFLFFSPGATDGPVEDCPNGGLEFHPYPFGAQSPDATLTYPPTVGSQIPGTMGFMLNAHFINIETTDYQATMTVTLHVASPGAVTQYAGVMFMNQAGITVPATDMPSTSSATCTTPYAMNVMGSSSHMHNRATDFVATTGSQTLYTTETWADPVPGKYDPPIALPSGAPITWSCTYVNDTTETLTFGESAETNVMCIYSMQFYPVQDPSNPTIDCEKL